MKTSSANASLVSAVCILLFIVAIISAVYVSIHTIPIYNTNIHAHLFEDLIRVNAPFVLLALVSYGIYKKTPWSKHLLYLVTGLTTLFLIIDIAATILHKHSFNYNDKSSIAITIILILLSIYVSKLKYREVR